MIVFSALVCPNPPSWQCEVLVTAWNPGLPLGQPHLRSLAEPKKIAHLTVMT